LQDTWLFLHVDSTVALYCLASMSSKTLVSVPLVRAIAKILLRHFQSLDREFGPVTVTACADAFGRNSQISLCWSAIDSCMGHLWYGMMVWCSPPFSMIAQIPRHFIRCRLASPMGTPMLHTSYQPGWTRIGAGASTRPCTAYS
jgi:hypothetical protein